jgi:hypothetical protein
MTMGMEDPDEGNDGKNLLNQIGSLHDNGRGCTGSLRRGGW